MAITTTITAIPTTVPISAAARTLIICGGHYTVSVRRPLRYRDTASQKYRMQGMTEVPSNVEDGYRCLTGETSRR